jgi:beta-galactosidase
MLPGRLPGGRVSCLAVLLCLTACSPDESTRTGTQPTASAGGVVVRSGSRIETRLDEGWRFLRSDARNAERSDFDDSAWKRVDLPHDFSIEDQPDKASPFSSSAPNGRDTGYTLGGTAWYRLRIPATDLPAGRRYLLRFDGVYMNADFWINGASLGTHPYGYTPFLSDVSEHMERTRDNVIAVRVRNLGANSRWYSGSGIYRHVWLTETDAVHVATFGVYVTTPQATASASTARVRTTVQNDSSADATVPVLTRILDPDGAEVARDVTAATVAKASRTEVDQVIALGRVRLWSVESPSLYRAVTTFGSDDGKHDQVTTTFGVRSIGFSADMGFLLNGRPLKLRGGCVHHDNGPLGAAAFDRAEERRVEILKKAGFNAVRTAHNPPSPAFLDACDRLGVLVIDEAFDCWMTGKRKDDYHRHFREWWERDLDGMVLRDRNHPSIILWSIGNEIPDREKPEGVATSRLLANHVRAADPTRPVTMGTDLVTDTTDALLETLDIAGYNYRVDRYDTDHRRVPSRVIVAMESFPRDTFDSWRGVEIRSWVIGDFVWTAFDYIGEAGIGWLGCCADVDSWPFTLAYDADIDLTGVRRPQSYYRNVVWRAGDRIAAFVHAPASEWGTPTSGNGWGWDDVYASWNWPGQEGKTLEVDVYTSCTQVDLLQDGTSLGRKAASAGTRYIASWNVVYVPGTLEAVCLADGAPTGDVSELATTGAAVRVNLTVDRPTVAADGQDLAFVSVELQDGEGRRVPDAEIAIHLAVEGPGTLAAFGSAKPISTESFRRSDRTTWQGRALAVVRSTRTAGTVTVTATAVGLTAGSATLIAR